MQVIFLVIFLRGVPLIEGAFDLLSSVDPGISIFPQEPVAAHDVPFAEAILADRLEHVLGRGGAEVAAGAGGVCEDVVVEEDHLFGEQAHGRELFSLWFRGSGLVAEASIFAPWLYIANFGEEGEGEEEESKFKKHCSLCQFVINIIRLS